MAMTTVANDVATKTKSPYQLDIPQTTKASTVLLRHVSDEAKRKQESVVKPNLLADPEEDSADEDSAGQDETPIWLVVSTKRHIVDKKRLKPSKIPLPHSFNTSTNGSVCLITADPQRVYKDLVADPSFPASLRPRVTRVIALSKLSSRYKVYENRRQLAAEHDLFLADDRIITALPKILGKVFYKTGSKRPIPVDISGPAPRGDDGKRLKGVAPIGNKLKKPIDKNNAPNAPTPTALAKEIDRAINSAMVHLAPGTSTAIKIGHAGFTPEMCTENIKAVTQALTEKFIPQGWRNIRAIHIKGPNTMAFPVWLASELWVDEGDILAEKKTFGKTKPKLLSGSTVTDEAVTSSKRKADDVDKPASGIKHIKKKRKADLEAEEKKAINRKATKERLRESKSRALAEGLNEVL